MKSGNSSLVRGSILPSHIYRRSCHPVLQLLDVFDHRDARPGHRVIGASIALCRGRTVIVADTAVHDMPSSEELADIAEEAAGLRFVFAPERPDPKERLEAIEKFVALGGKVAEREVRDLLGLAEPTEEDKVLGGGTGMAEPDALSSLLKTPMPPEQGQPPEGTPPAEGAPRAFSRRSWW